MLNMLSSLNIEIIIIIIIDPLEERIYRHGKKLGNTFCVTKVNFGLKFPRVKYVLFFLKNVQLIKICSIQTCFDVKMVSGRQLLRLTAVILDTEIIFLIFGPH